MRLIDYKIEGDTVIRRHRRAQAGSSASENGSTKPKAGESYHLIPLIVTLDLMILLRLGDLAQGLGRGGG